MKNNIKTKLKSIKSSSGYRIRKAKEFGNSRIFKYMNKEYLSFSSNDYLSLSNDKRIINAAKRALDNHGYSVSSSALISGYTKYHRKLEEELSEFLGNEKTLLFSTGYQANLGVIKSLVDQGDFIHSDRLNHASLIDGAIISRGKFKRYKHNNIKDLEKNLILSNTNNHNLIITDSLFSMDGDIANLKQLNKKAKQYNMNILVDEAHALGVYGCNGNGIINSLSLNNKNNIFTTGTFGKAVGTFGAFFSGKEDIVEYVLQKSRSYIYSTSLPVSAVEATRKSLKIIQKEDWRRDKLFSLINYFKKNVKSIRYDTLNSSSQIQGIIIGDAKKTIEISNELFKKNIYIPSIRPPTVEEGKSRLRISLTVDHSEADIDYLLNILDKTSRNLVQS